ncbi:MAG: TetR/AcrR family transcriptional regulator [Actinomycetota bacterium]
MATRTQTERTEATRALLVGAALDLLDERGWAATTSVAVCERAGVTRGALVHHFGALPALLADALEVHHGRLAVLADESDPTTLRDLIEATWRVIDRGSFKIVIEAWLAASNDPELGEAIRPVVERFAKLVDPIGRAPLRDVGAQRLYLAAREAMFGLALGRATAGAPLGHERLVIDQFLSLADAFDVDRRTN